MKKGKLKGILATAFAVIVYGVYAFVGGDTQQGNDETRSEETTETVAEVMTETEDAGDISDVEMETYYEGELEYSFRNENLLEEHYEKHGIEMGFDSMEEYEAAAVAVILNENALYREEEEDGDGVYYIEETNEFVVLSQDGYIRTYFNPSDGIEYFERQ